MSRDELASSKSRWLETIQHVQNIDLDLADKIDASEYMGLERYLTKDIMKHLDENRLNYIDSVIKAQHGYSCHSDLARFARRGTRANVARSHAVGVFYEKKCFQEFKADQVIHDFRYQPSKLTGAHRSKLNYCYIKLGLKRPQLRKSAGASCA